MNMSSSHFTVNRERCPSCGTTATRLMIKLPFNQPPISNYIRSYYEGRANESLLEGTHFEVRQCSKCALIFQRSVPVGSLLADLYDRWIPATERERLRKTYSLKMYRNLAAQVDFVIQHFALPPSEIDMFDFGLGWSEWAGVARAFGCNVAGAELSVERKAHAQSIGIEIVELEDISDRRFHYINTEQVFEHLVNPQEVLKSLAASLRPCGIIKISVPDGRGIAEKLKKITSSTPWAQDELMPIAPLEHINCFDYRSLTELGKGVGLLPIRPSLRQLYNAASGWLDPMTALSNLVRPLYRHILPKSTFVYFLKPEGA